jgi:membrane protease subunit (stomatin/prohibitin family)
MAMEKAAESEGGSEMGMGTSLGLMMPAMFAQYFSGAQQQKGQEGARQTSPCPECQNAIPASSKFCPDCGHQLLVFTQCTRCNKNLMPNAKFCSRCGFPAEEQETAKFCKACGAENITDAMFCNECGEKF